MTVNRSDGVPLNWKAIGEFADLLEVVDLIPPEEVVKRLGNVVAIQAIGVEVAIEALGLDAVIQALGPGAALEMIGADRILTSPEVRNFFADWINRLTTEESRALLREREQRATAE